MSTTDDHLKQLGRRKRERPVLLLVGLVCAAAVLLEVAAFTGVFGLANRLWSTGGTPGPDLNPHHELIVAIGGNITYVGSVTGYFPALGGTSLCSGRCPQLPKVRTVSQGNLSPEIGIFFFFNVTNTANVVVNLSNPVLTTSGPVATLFYLQTYCCYTPAEPQYDELLGASISFSPGAEYGIEGYAYTTVPLPEVSGGGFTLFVNYT
jgi:hypothetical protein